MLNIMNNNISRILLAICLTMLISAAYSEVLADDYLFIDVDDTEVYKIDADTYQGYDWVIASMTDQTIVKYEGKENKFGEKNTDLTTQLIKFKGLKKGKTIVTLNYIKQGESIPKKTRKLVIRVY